MSSSIPFAPTSRSRRNKSSEYPRMAARGLFRWCDSPATICEKEGGEPPVCLLTFMTVMVLGSLSPHHREKPIVPAGPKWTAYTCICVIRRLHEQCPVSKVQI